MKRPAFVIPGPFRWNSWGVAANRPKPPLRTRGAAQRILTLGLVTLGLCLGLPLGAAEPTRAEREGQELVRQLREQSPLENSTTTGQLTVRQNRRLVATIPIRCDLVVTATNWQTIYLTEPTATNTPVERVTVLRDARGVNGYLFQSGTNGPMPVRLDQPFAGSDFWLMDLGLEFLHWPGQFVLRKELRSSTACTVLESVNPNPAALGYTRVISWVDIDSGGLVFAEAYDARGLLLKEFAPKKLQKVDGQYQLREMEMRNVQTGSRTRIEFELTTAGR